MCSSRHELNLMIFVFAVLQLLQKPFRQIIANRSKKSEILHNSSCVRYFEVNISVGAVVVLWSTVYQRATVHKVAVVTLPSAYTPLLWGHPRSLPNLDRRRTQSGTQLEHGSMPSLRKFISHASSACAATCPSATALFNLLHISIARLMEASSPHQTAWCYAASQNKSATNLNPLKHPSQSQMQHEDDHGAAAASLACACDTHQ